jgi:hypothetical protein
VRVVLILNNDSGFRLGVSRTTLNIVVLYVCFILLFVNKPLLEASSKIYISFESNSLVHENHGLC